MLWFDQQDYYVRVFTKASLKKAWEDIKSGVT